jgi:hypothetical protein
MIGFLRSLLPRWDRQATARFRDSRVAESIRSSERTLEANRALQRELRAIYLALPKENPSGAKRSVHL